MSENSSLNGLSSFTYLHPRQIACIGNVRKHFDETKLQELADSIKENGIIEPLIVRSNPDKAPDLKKDTFELIAGERRLRAARIAGLDKIPTRIMFLDRKQAAKLQLIENVQREDLNPIEEAQAYKVLLNEHEYTQEKLGSELGVSQAHIANRMRLLELPDSVQQNISRGIISASHGKVLAGHKQLPEKILEKAAADMAEKNVPVAKANDFIGEVIGKEGKPLFQDYSTGPEFKTEDCEGCESRVMGRRYSHDNTEHPYCLKPSCWEKKQHGVKQAREQAIAAQAQKAAKNGQGVVELDKFQWDQYEEFQDYKIEDMDLSECQDCEHKKVAKRSYRDGLTEACFLPSCFKKKQAAATREKNKQTRDALQVELEGIAELSQKAAADACRTVSMPRQALVYLAAQVLANVQNHYERKVTRYQYVKDKFGWDDGVFKSTAYHSLGSEWEPFRARLESLTEQQLWEIIFEWPAVAEGLTGIRSWILEDGFLPDADQEQRQDPVFALVGRTIRTHYNTGGVVTYASGPRPGLAGFYTINYKKNPKDKKFGILNTITIQDGVVLCEGIPLAIEPEEKAYIHDDKAGHGTCRVCGCPDHMPCPEDGYWVEPDLCNRCAEAVNLSPQHTSYLHDGKEIFVSAGLNPAQFGTFWRSLSGGLHRVKSPAMPMVPTREEAQRNLDAWAWEKGLQAVVRSDSAC